MTMVWPRPGLSVRKQYGGYYSPAGEDVIVTRYVEKQLESGDLFDHDPLTSPPPRVNAAIEATDQLLAPADLNTKCGVYNGAGVRCTDGTAWKWIEGDSTATSTTIKGTTPYGRWFRLTEVTTGGSLSVYGVTGIFASTIQEQDERRLAPDFNDVTTVANTNDTVTLRPAIANTLQVIVNSGANTLQIFPASGDDLGAGVNTPTTLAVGAKAMWWAINATTWRRII